jgi:GxxExxY protein
MVTEHVFAIHNEFGRFFDEKIYKRELTRRMNGVRLEVPIDVSLDSFLKRYFLDLVVGNGALFEFKCVETLTARHRAQTIHYLLLAGLAHAKLVNMRPEKIEHEFVNTTLNDANRRSFTLRNADWNPALPGAARFHEILSRVLYDWGTGLELPLYEEALTYFLGGEQTVCAEIAVTSRDSDLGTLRVRLAAPNVAFKLTALTERPEAFASHARRLLAHTPLTAILWANLTPGTVTFTALH